MYDRYDEEDHLPPPLMMKAAKSTNDEGRGRRHGNVKCVTPNTHFLHAYIYYD